MFLNVETQSNSAKVSQTDYFIVNLVAVLIIVHTTTKAGAGVSESESNYLLF